MHLIVVAQKRIQQFVQENSSTLLTAGSVVGTVATGVLAGRAGLKAGEIIADYEAEQAQVVEAHDLSKTEKAKLVWAQFIPPIITGTATIGGIIMANRMNAQRAAALAAAYGLSQRQLEEYKEKVAEKLTGPKNQQIKDELAQDRVNKTPGSSQVIVVEGEVLCFDAPTGRYFHSTMEKINQAVNRINEEIIHHDHVSATTFYDELGLPETTWSNEVGWNSAHLLKLDISTTMAEDNKPCIVIDFDPLPTADFQRNMF